MDLAADAGVRAEYEVFPLEAANDALLAIKRDEVRGAAVLACADRHAGTMGRSRPSHARWHARSRAHALTWKLHA